MVPTSLTARLLVTLLVASTAIAAPAVDPRQSSCTNPKQRRAWHTFTDTEKKAYIDAELCLMKKPATLGLRGAKTRFDELQSCHILQSEITHFVGAFLPFHRLLMWAHEQSLQTLCGYSGSQPYWEEQLDAGKFSKSVVLDPVTGFGGNGAAPSNCIQDGPFADYMNTLGPGYTVNDHCIDRSVNDMMSTGSSQAEVDKCLAATTWIDAWGCIEGRPHSGGHGGIGAEMLNPISSPGDPLFYLHHTWLDKIWWDWQKQDLPGRLTEMGGRNTFNSSAGFPGGGFPGGGFPGGGFPGGGFPGGGFPGGGFPGGGFPGGAGGATGTPPATSGTPSGVGLPGPSGTAGASPFGLFAFFPRPDDVPEPKVVGDPGNVTTLNHVINMYGVAPSMTIAEVMDIRGALCYEYIDP